MKGLKLFILIPVIPLIILLVLGIYTYILIKLNNLAEFVLYIESNELYNSFVKLNKVYNIKHIFRLIAIFLWYFIIKNLLIK